MDDRLISVSTVRSLKTLLVTVGAAALLVQAGAAPAAAANGRPSCQQKLTSFTVSAATVTSGGSLTGQVTLACRAGSTGLTVALASSTSALAVPASVQVTDGNRSATFTATAGQVTTSTVATLTATYAAVSLTSTVTVNPLQPPAYPQAASLTVNPASVTAGQSVTATVTLSAPAPAGGATVAVSADHAIVSVPASVTVPQGATAASFTVATIAEPDQAYSQSVGLRAAYGGATAAAVLIVFPPPPPGGVSVSSLTLSQPSMVGGSDPVTATVTLNTTAPSDVVVYFYGSAYGPVQMTPTLVIPAGQSTGSTRLRSDQVTADYDYTLTAEIQGTTPVGVHLLITPGPFALRLSTTTVAHGSTATGTLSLNGGPQAVDVIVALSSTIAGVTVPATVTIPAGAASATFSVTAGATSSGTGSLRATYAGVDKYLYLAVF